MIFFLFSLQVNSKNLKGKTIKGVCVGRFHTVLYTSDAVYTCGLNAGQLGEDLTLPSTTHVDMCKM